MDGGTVLILVFLAVFLLYLFSKLRGESGSGERKDSDGGGGSCCH